MIIFLAGAESARYQEALLRGGAPSLQTFYAQRSIREILNMKEQLDHGQDDLPVRPDPRAQ